MTDEGRGWASDEMLNWTSSMNLKHVMAPGREETCCSEESHRDLPGSQSSTARWFTKL